MEEGEKRSERESEKERELFLSMSKEKERVFFLLMSKKGGKHIVDRLGLRCFLLLFVVKERLHLSQDCIAKGLACPVARWHLDRVAVSS